MKLQAGDRVGENYVIDQYVGRGRSGAIYQARNLHLGHSVVIKVYRVTDQTARQRFERSARLMAQIRSPHVVSLLDYWFEGPTPIMAMEYTPGQSLRALIKQRGALPWPMAVGIMRGVLGGLDAIHDAAVLHRNLTPENVIVSPGDPAPSVKLTDLSLAKSMMGGSSRITAAGMVVGIPSYMSPEQIRQERVDARSDLYAAGVLLYEMVTGKLPRPGDDLMALLRTLNHPLSPPVAPPGMPPLPPELVAALASTLQPERNLRPMSAVDVAGLFNAVRQHAPTVASAMAVSLPPPPAPNAAPAPNLRLSAESRAWQKLERRAELSGAKPRTVADPSQLSASSEVVFHASLPRIRAILAGQLPDSIAARTQAQAWLRTLVPSGQNFFVGSGFWVAVLIAANDDDAKNLGRQITQTIFGRFGESLPVRAKMVSSTFVLPRSCVEGTSPPPFEVLSLLEQLARQRKA